MYIHCIYYAILLTSLIALNHIRNVFLNFRKLGNSCYHWVLGALCPPPPPLGFATDFKFEYILYCKFCLKYYHAD